MFLKEWKGRNEEERENEKVRYFYLQGTKRQGRDGYLERRSHRDVRYPCQ